MIKVIIQDNYFIEYEYTEDGKFRVDLQELRGSNKQFSYLFKIIRRTSEQYVDLIGDAIFCHELFKKRIYGTKAN